VTESEQKLEKNAVGLFQGVFQSLGQVAPAADIAILLVASFSTSGDETVLAVIIAWLIYALWMVTPYMFAKRKSNAGSYYAYAASSTDKGRLGPITAMTFMYYDITGAAFGILGLSSFLFLISPSITGIPYIWILFAAAFTAYVAILTYTGIKPSLTYTAISGLAEVAFLFIAAIIIIIEVGKGNSLVPFEFSGKYAVGVSAIMFGAIFSILDFTGSGVVTTVSEEIKEPKKNVGRSIIFAMVLTAIALIPATYALTVGWGVNNISTFATHNDAGLIVFGKYLGPIGVVLLIVFTVNSYLSNGVAKATAVGRWWYSAGRDGVVFPKSFGEVHRKYRTPAKATMAWILSSFVLDVLMGLKFGPENAAFVLEAGTGISIIIVHILANTSLSLYGLRKKEFRFLSFGMAPLISSIIGFIVIYISMSDIISKYLSNPASPVDSAYLYSFIITVLWIVVGGAAVTYYYSRNRPKTLEKAGEFDVEDPPS
jgi:amino acid transporter